MKGHGKQKIKIKMYKEIKVLSTRPTAFTAFVMKCCDFPWSWIPSPPQRAPLRVTGVINISLSNCIRCGFLVFSVWASLNSLSLGCVHSRPMVIKLLLICGPVLCPSFSWVSLPFVFSNFNLSLPQSRSYILWGALKWLLSLSVEKQLKQMFC